MGIVKRIFLGRNDSTDAELYQTNTGNQDGGEDYNGYALSDRFAPAGIGGEVAFYGLFIPVIFDTDDTPISVTVYIDDEERVTRDFVLTNANDPERLRTILEISLLEQLDASVDPSGTRGQWATRGTWIQVEIETGFVGGVGFVQIDGVELEHEIVQEGKTEGQNNPT